MNGFMTILRRDLHLAIRQSIDSMTVVMFFVLVVIIFPFGVGPEPNILARIASGVIWVAALLASTLSLERLFQIDYEDGSLELLSLSSVALEVIVLAKVTALAYHGFAVDNHCPFVSDITEHEQRRLPCIDTSTSCGNTLFKPNRRSRGSTNTRGTTRRSSTRTNYTAFIYPSADFRS